MKYYIYINQSELAKTSLDLIDSAILDYLYVIGNSRHEKIEKARVDGYTWIDYSKLIEENPLLRIKSKGAITPRIKRIQEAGFIKTIERRRNGHKQIFIKTTYKVDSLFIRMNNPIHETEKPIHETEPINTTKINTTKDKREAKPSKPESSITYLDNLTLEVKREFCEKYNCKVSDVNGIIEEMKLYCGSTGKTYKDYNLAIQSWLMRRFNLKKENHLRFKKEEVLSK